MRKIAITSLFATVLIDTLVHIRIYGEELYSSGRPSNHSNYYTGLNQINEEPVSVEMS